jgi:hypothetical protein
MNKIEKLRNFLIDEGYAGTQTFDCRNIVGDPMSNIYDEDGITVDFCYHYDYLYSMKAMPTGVNEFCLCREYVWDLFRRCCICNIANYNLYRQKVDGLSQNEMTLSDYPCLKIQYACRTYLSELCHRGKVHVFYAYYK